MQQPDSPRPIANAETVVRLVDDYNNALFVVCLNLDISIVVGWRLLEEGRRLRALRRALGQREKGA